MSASLKYDRDLEYSGAKCSAVPVLSHHFSGIVRIGEQHPKWWGSPVENSYNTLLLNLKGPLQGLTLLTQIPINLKKVFQSVKLKLLFAFILKRDYANETSQNRPALESQCTQATAVERISPDQPGRWL